LGSPTFPRPFEGVEDWFDKHVIHELILIKRMCLELSNNVCRDLALTAFSSIIVTVSRQDSDTRYVRREKGIHPGDTLHYFSDALNDAVDRVLALGTVVSKNSSAHVVNADILSKPQVGLVDLVVCSPPYPNAYSYHLYH